MQFIITTDVTHKVNGDYPCVLVQFEDSDKHYFTDKKNWMPKDEEVINLVKIMMLFSPTFKAEFNKYNNHAKA